MHHNDGVGDGLLWDGGRGEGWELGPCHGAHKTHQLGIDLSPPPTPSTRTQTHLLSMSKERDVGWITYVAPGGTKLSAVVSVSPTTS